MRGRWRRHWRIELSYLFWQPVELTAVTLWARLRRAMGR